MISGWVQKVTQHNGTIQYLVPSLLNYFHQMSGKSVVRRWSQPTSQSNMQDPKSTDTDQKLDSGSLNFSKIENPHFPSKKIKFSFKIIVSEEKFPWKINFVQMKFYAASNSAVWCMMRFFATHPRKREQTRLGLAWQRKRNDFAVPTQGLSFCFVLPIGHTFPYHFVQKVSLHPVLQHLLVQTAHIVIVNVGDIRRNRDGYKHVIRSTSRLLPECRLHFLQNEKRKSLDWLIDWLMYLFNSPQNPKVTGK